MTTGSGYKSYVGKIKQSFPFRGNCAKTGLLVPQKSSELGRNIADHHLKLGTCTAKAPTPNFGNPFLPQN
jgi:hypothetical protein